VKFHAVPKLGVNSHARISNGKSCERKQGNTLGRSTIRCNAQIQSRPKGQGWSE